MVLKIMSDISPLRASALLESGRSLSVDSDTAKLLLDDCPYVAQRPLNDDRVYLLADAMEQGTFMPNTQVSFARLGGRFYLVNGQHRLNAVGLARVPQSFRIEVYECRTIDEVHSLYTRFDQPGGQRSLTQVSRSLNLHDDGPGGLRPPTAALLLRAAPLLMIDLKRIAPSLRPRATRDLDRKKEVALKWKPQAIDYQACLDHGIGVRTARFRAGGVFAVALVTLRYQRERAMPFWSEACRNSGLMSGDPRHALHAHFLSSKRATSEYELAEAACNAWNAWFRNKPLTICRALGSPLRLAGTPYQDAE